MVLTLTVSLETWSGELVSRSVCVPSSSAVELVGDGDPSDSSWEFVSACGWFGVCSFCGDLCARMCLRILSGIFVDPQSFFSFQEA